MNTGKWIEITIVKKPDGQLCLAECYSSYAYAAGGFQYIEKRIASIDESDEENFHGILRPRGTHRNGGRLSAVFENRVSFVPPPDAGFVRLLL